MDEYETGLQMTWSGCEVGVQNSFHRMIAKLMCKRLLCYLVSPYSVETLLDIASKLDELWDSGERDSYL